MTRPARKRRRVRAAPEPPDFMPLLDRALAAARRLGAEACEAYGSWSWGARYAVERGAVDAGEASASGGIGLRVVRDGRAGYASTSRVDAAALRRTAERALDALRALGPAPLDLPRRHAAPRVPGLVDRRVADLQPEDGLAAARDLVAGAREAAPDAAVPNASYAWGVDAQWIANSEGLAAATRGSGLGAYCSVVLERKQISTGSESREGRRADLDAADVGRAAARMAVEAQGARRLPRQPKTVLLGPEAGAPLFELLLVLPLLGERVARGESPYAGQLGKPIAHASLSVLDDPTRPGGLGSAPRDEEGVASRAVPLVRRGVNRALTWDLASAGQYGGATTASGARGEAWGGGSGYQNPPSPSPRNVRFEVRGAVPFDRLLAEVGTGVLVHEALGVHTANAVTGDFSVTSSSLVWVERGEVKHALKPCALSGSMPTVARSLVGASREVKEHSGDRGGAYTTPTFAVRGIRVVP